MDAGLDFIYSNNVICPLLDSESHFTQGVEWKTHSKSKSLNSHSTTQSSSSHHFLLVSVVLFLSAPLVTVLRAQSAPAPVPSVLTHTPEGTVIALGRVVCSTTLSSSLHHTLTNSRVYNESRVCYARHTPISCKISTIFIFGEGNKNQIFRYSHMDRINVFVL